MAEPITASRESIDRRPLLLVISGPSGVGKTSLARLLLERESYFRRAITATTRAPRGDERDGIDYHFLSAETFERRARAGDFLEHAEVYGRRYGTPRASVDAVLANGCCGILVVDVQGARSLREALADAPWPVRTVFVKPPSLAELGRRLEQRGEDGEAAIARRLEIARDELREARGFDLVLVNDDLERAYVRLEKAVRSWTRPSGRARK